MAKAINSHLAEVQRCYESALLKNPGLAGKVVLEWSISTQGRVESSEEQELHLEGQLGGERASCARSTPGNSHPLAASR